MLRGSRLVKSALALIFPTLLFILFVIQVFQCHMRLRLRNPYLLESLPRHSDWVWNALSGSVQSEIFTEVANHNADIHERKYSSNLNASHYSKLNSHVTILRPGIPTFTVHYLWCIDGHFELAHYLSILSVISQLQPDKIVIHYRAFPRSDPHGYWKWLEDLQRDVVMLSMRPLKNPRHCRHDFFAGVAHDFDDFHDPYGVFLLGDILITKLTRSDVVKLIHESLSHGMSRLHGENQSLPSQEVSHESQLFLVPDSEPYHITQSPSRIVISCPAVTLIDKSESVTQCMNINSYINPDELFKRDTKLFRFARQLMFGSPAPVTAEMARTLQIPNIVHIILIDENVSKVSPLLFVSIKSAFARGKVDAVYIHGPNRPSGPLWEQLYENDQIDMRYIPTLSSEEIGSKHAGLIYALYTLLQHGGVVHFGDVVFMAPIPSSVRHAGALATLHYSSYRQRHRSTNTVILAGGKGSKFIELVLARIRQQDALFSEERADDITAHVSEMEPEAVLLDSKLTTHLNCEKKRCLVAGGYGHPHQSYTARLIWKDKQPHTLEGLMHIEGPIQDDIHEIINH